MASPMTPDDLLKALRDEGVKVVEYKEWRTHNRDHVGAWGPVHGVMIHHTVTSGTAGSVELCYTGYQDLPGPLCHGVIAKDGTVHLVGHGRANHAGKGDSAVLEAVKEEAPLPPDTKADTDGNTHFYGFECVNLGDGDDPWPAEQVEAIVRVSAALCRFHGWGGDGPTSVIGHLEWQPGKIDPRGPGISMNAIRAQVWDRLDRPPGWNPGGNDMPRYLALAMTRPFVINDPGVWVSLTWDTEWADDAEQHFDGAQAFASDGAQYAGVLHVKVSGLAPGEEIQVRVVEGDGTDERRLPIAEGVGTGGGSYIAVPVCGKVSPGRRAKLMLAQFNGDAGPVTVERAELKAQVWP